ncbi:hypothetical protein ACFFHT_04215 [Gallibacterium melopsittaci]|uniref:Acid shock protein n=1 Tax=Gallibacterium melopsittaci TaxID=516063 RepID=A0ABV6HV77_9PAST
MLVSKKIIMSSLVASVLAMATVAQADATPATVQPQAAPAKAEQVMPKATKVAAKSDVKAHAVKQVKTVKHHAKKVSHKKGVIQDQKTPA